MKLAIDRTLAGPRTRVYSPLNHAKLAADVVLVKLIQSLT